MAEMEVIKPGKKHPLNSGPHFSESGELGLTSDHVHNPFVFELADGSQVKVYATRGGWAKITKETVLTDRQAGFPVPRLKKGNYSRLLLDEVCEPGSEEFKPVAAPARKALLFALARDHKLYPSRF